MPVYILQLNDEEQEALKRYAEANGCSEGEAVNRIFDEALQRFDEAERCMRSIEDYERTGRSAPISEIDKRYR